MKKYRLSKIIHHLEKPNGVFDYFLANQEILKTEADKELARQSLADVQQLRKSYDAAASQQTVSMNSTHILNANQSFRHKNPGKTENCDSIKQLITVEGNHKLIISGLEELTNRLKIHCDKSCLDSKSTQAGTDSLERENGPA